MWKGTEWLYSYCFHKGEERWYISNYLESKICKWIVEYKHFKMESLEGVFEIIKADAWMASVDIKDAFFTIPVHSLYQKYFKFEWFNQLYKFLGMRNGYSDAMRTFTKLLKPVFWGSSLLSQQMYMFCLYLQPDIWGRKVILQLYLLMAPIYK